MLLSATLLDTNTHSRCSGPKPSITVWPPDQRIAQTAQQPYTPTQPPTQTMNQKTHEGQRSAGAAEHRCW